MSRTFRRKGYEKTVANQMGHKVNGYYTEWEWVGCSLIVFRPMTEREKNKEYWRVHGESKHRNAWSPGRNYRKTYQDQHRTREKQELSRCLNSSQYDPVFYPKPSSCWYDWS